MSRLKENKLVQLSVSAALTVILYVIFYHAQEPLTYSFSALFDGNQYIKIYQYFKGIATDYNVSFPYHSRILVPFLASLLPYDAINAFSYLNFLFILGGVMAVCICWDLLKIPFHLSLAGIIWLTIHWTGIIRYNLFDPVTVDVPLYLLQIVFLFAILRDKPWIMLTAAILSVIDKESIIAFTFVMTAYFLYRRYLNKESSGKVIFYSVTLLLILMIKWLLNHYFPPAEHGRGSVITLLFHARETMMHPFRIIHWLSGLSVAFGPWLALYIMTKIKERNFNNNEIRTGFLALTSLAISFLGGGDFTRLIFLGFPFIMTLFFLGMKNLKPGVIYFTLMVGLPLTRFWEVIPNPGLNGWWAFYNWHPEFAVPPITWMWIGYMMFSGIVIYLIRSKITGRT